MNSEEILKADVLDIIFENRNQQYGAYTLRKWYNSRLIKSLVIMTGVVTVLSAFTLIPKKNKKIKIDYIVSDTGFANPPKAAKKQPEPKPQPTNHKVIENNSQKFVSNLLIVKTDTIAKLNTLKDNAAIGDANNKGKQVGPTVITPLSTGTGTGKDTVKTVVFSQPEITASPEMMPEFPGGVNALRRFLEKNLTNPRQLEEGEIISVKVKMVVGIDGKLQSFQTIEDGGNEFNNEVIRVLKKMPDWVPGKTNGKNISVYYTIPVKFIAADQ